MANLEVIALDTVTPQLKAPQAGDGYAMPRPVTVTEVVGSTALTLTGATQTASTPVLNATQTWNNAAIAFTAIKLNITDTASTGLSFFADFQVSSVSKFQFRKDGGVQIAGSLYGGNAAAPIWALAGAGLNLADGRFVAWSSAGTFGSFSAGTSDLYLSRKGAASLQFGQGDAAAPVAQTIGPQSVVAGTSNTAGASFTVRGSQGTGTGVGGDIIFQTASAGSTGTAQNALTTRLTIGGNGGVTFNIAVGQAISLNTNRIFQYAAGTAEGVSFGNFTGGHGYIAGPNAGYFFAPSTAFAGNPDVAFQRHAVNVVKVTNGSTGVGIIQTPATTVAALPAAATAGAGARSFVTDALATVFLSVVAGGGANKVPVVSDGTNWVIG